MGEMVIVAGEDAFLNPVMVGLMVRGEAVMMGVMEQGKTFLRITLKTIIN